MSTSIVRRKINPKFVVDDKGRKKEVILDYEYFQELIEDLEDLRDVGLRRMEPSRPFEEFHREKMRK